MVTLNNIVDRLTTELETAQIEAGQEDTSSLENRHVMIQILENAFRQLKAFVSDYKFKNEKDEILFFKETKPSLFSKLIYYNKVNCIESLRPSGSFDTIRSYLMNELDRLTDFYNQNIEFYKYYRSGSSMFDEYYFLRGKHDIQMNVECFYFERDPKFSTNYDFQAAILLANDMLAAYLNEELVKLKRTEIQLESIMDIISTEKWTDKKTALVELIYSIHEERSVNNGNTELKILAEKFGKMFNIDLSDIYRIFLEIRGRKGERAVYLKRLVDALNKRMDEADSR